MKRLVFIFVFFLVQVVNAKPLNKEKKKLLREEMKVFPKIASMLYNEGDIVLIQHGELHIDSQFLSKKTYNNPPYYGVHKIQDENQLQEAVSKCVFVEKMPVHPRVHKFSNQLVERSNIFLELLKLKSGLFDYYYLPGFETDRDNWDFASCGLGVKYKLQGISRKNAYGKMLVLQAAKF